MRVKLTVIFLAILLIFSACGTGAVNISATPSEAEDFMMGTVISQRVYGEGAEAAMKAAAARLKEIESLMTINAPGGDINRLNEAAGKDKVALEPETINILATAKKYAQVSGGTFDVTIGPLVKAWGVFTDHPRVPSADEIEKLKKLTDYKTLQVDTENNTAALEMSGQIVDLGGIAKGYAGDEAIKVYKEHGIKSAYINLGGNVVVLGTKPDGKPWRIGIQNPRANNGYYIGIVEVTDKAVVTSGDYERFFEKDGVRYHHILDPKTGRPAASGLISATIITDVSMDADALSTAVFVLGLEKGMALVKGLKGVEAILVTRDREIYATEGIRSSFKFTDESKEYKYVEKG